VREDDLADALEQVVVRLQDRPPDYEALGPAQADLLWRIPELHTWLADRALGKLLWSPRDGEIAFTCLDAAPVIGETIRRFGATILASATLGPADDLVSTLGLEGGDTLTHETTPVRVTAHTPWRDGAYDVGCDLRVDTSYQQRARHHATTAATVESLCAAAQRSPDGIRGAVVFFPSYRYAETIVTELDRQGSLLRIALQPRLPDLAAQAAWVEESLAFADVLFLVLGSSFAEGIDLLGGRVGHAMVVGPALPEVNAVQKARLENLSRLGRETAIRRVYRLPGLQKVNQALGRLVRAPGHRAKVLLHCRRFVEPAFASLLAPDYQFGRVLHDDAELHAWLSDPSA
jgi:Rad3-related DNA helicase